MNFNRISQYALTCILAVLIFLPSNAQSIIRIGFKTHPNFSFSSIADKSNFDRNLFSVRNGLIGLNVGACVNFQRNEWLLEFATGINSNRTGLKFHNNLDIAQLSMRTLSFTNELNFGIRVFMSNKPYYEVFLTSSYSYSLVAIQKLSGNSQFENIINYEEIYPNLDLSWQSSNLGTGVRIRTQLKNGRKFDYGISFRVAVKKYPEIGMKIEYPTETFQTLVRPRLTALNIDFIYYFGKRKSS